MKKYFKFVTPLLILIIVLTGCAQGTTPNLETPTNANINNTAEVPSAIPPEASGPKYGGTLVVATKLEPKSFNLNYVWDGAIPYLSTNILSKLVNYDGFTKEIYGDLAESWTNSDDLMKYTLILKKDVKWHDGEPFTSADVKWTIDSILQMGDKAAAFNILKTVDSVDTPDDYTVILNLKVPNGAMIPYLASYNGFFILPKHLYEGTDPLTNPYNSKPIGTGPFKFVEHVIGSHVTLEANKDYYGEGPYLDKVIFSFSPNDTTSIAALEAGEIGFMTATPPFADVKRLSSLSNVKVDMTSSTIVQWMGMNAERDYMKDPLVRQAIFYSVDREDIANKLYFGLVKPAESFYTTAIAWADNKDVRQPSLDIDKANVLLDQAGYKKDANGKRFTLVYRVFPTSIYGTTDIPKFVTQYLSKVGIEVKIEQYEWALRTQKLIKERDWDLCSGGGDRGPDPVSFATFVSSTGSGNVMKYSNPEVDQLFEEGTKSADTAVRAQSYFKIQEILSTDLPMLNFVEYAYARVYNAEYSGFFFQKSSGGKSADHMFNAVQWINGKVK